MTIEGLIDKAYVTAFRNAFNSVVFESSGRPLKTYLIAYGKKLFYINGFEQPKLNADFVYELYFSKEQFSNMYMSLLTDKKPQQYRFYYEQLNDDFERHITDFVRWPKALYDKICKILVESPRLQPEEYEACAQAICDSVIDEEDFTIIDSGILYNFITEAEEHKHEL